MSGLVDFFREARPYIDAAGAILAIIVLIGAGIRLGTVWLIKKMTEKD